MPFAHVACELACSWINISYRVITQTTCHEVAHFYVERLKDVMYMSACHAGRMFHAWFRRKSSPCGGAYTRLMNPGMFAIDRDTTEGVTKQ